MVWLAPPPYPRRAAPERGRHQDHPNVGTWFEQPPPDIRMQPARGDTTTAGTAAADPPWGRFQETDVGGTRRFAARHADPHGRQIRHSSD